MKIIKMKIDSGTDNKVLKGYIIDRLVNLNIKEIEVKDEYPKRKKKKRKEI